MFRLKMVKKPKLFKLKFNFIFPQIVLANMQEKEITPTKETQIVEPDKNYDGLKKVTVNKIPDEYISGYNLSIQLQDIVISTCTVSETTTQSPSPTINREDNYLASIYDTDAIYAFSNAGYNLTAGSYKPSGVYTYTGMNFEHTAQSYTTLIQAGDRRDIVGKHLKGKYGMVFVVGAKVSADGSGSSNRLYMAKTENYTPPTVDIDCVVGDRNTSGKPITFELPSFTFSCDGYYYSKYNLYENQITLSVVLYPIKVTLS